MNSMAINKLSSSHGRLLNFMAMALILVANSSVLAQSPGSDSSAAKDNKSATQPTSDKLDLGNLEQKYWSAKDDDFTVVQNRTYTKDRKFYLNAMSGLLVNDGFLEGKPSSLGLGYYFNEKNGLSVDYTSFYTYDSSVTKAFRGQFGGLAPAYNSPLSTLSLTYMWSPIYAKVSLLERKIMYLDMSFGVHAGTTTYKSNSVDKDLKFSTSHYGIDVSQLWFVNKRLAFRFDIRSSWSTQKQYKYHLSTNLPEEQRFQGNVRLQDNTWLLGVNLFFGR